MRFGTRFTIFVDAFRKRVRRGKNSGLHQTAALIRKEARESMRIRRKASLPGTPPSAHTRTGLKEINYFVENDSKAFIGPRIFRRKNRLSKPVPNVHEFGGPALERRKTKTIVRVFHERSFMWAAVRSLKRKGKLNSKFRFMLRK